MRMALVFYWAPNSAGAEAKSAEPIIANKPRPIILTEIPPLSTHMAAMRALPAEFNGCLTRHGQIRPGGGLDSAAPAGRQFDQLVMSAFGTKRTSRHAQPMSAFGGKADIAGMAAAIVHLAEPAASRDACLSVVGKRAFGIQQLLLIGRPITN
jgi:hypothetical protein